METVEDIVIVGAGIAGLTTSLGLHRHAGNQKLGIGIIREFEGHWICLHNMEIVVTSSTSGQPSSERSLKAKGKHGENETRCVRRKLLLEALEKELPSGTIRFSSKVVSVEESGYFKLVHLDDGNKEVEDDPAKMKQFVLRKCHELPDRVKAVLDNTPLDGIICSPLRYRHPWEVLWGNISKGNVCVAGDALHPMTPDLGQGGCAALEDGIVLARSIAEVLKKTPSEEIEETAAGELEKEEFKSIEMGLKKFAKERRWRSFDLITTAYVVGSIQQSEGKIMNLLRDIFSVYLAGLLSKRADFDFGKLTISDHMQ
ncbi:hypothetical protein Pint_34331 [Pistacia integerrima]|uniref:Uncharacterized protein n=1 Tax=Pistacia integerrima TaxID=434235 RepID=A0ACC0X3F1_9ROSI|nr:hypothetical protein Pint_34331 [Pistacia integerrima]